MTGRVEEKEKSVQKVEYEVKVMLLLLVPLRVCGGGGGKS